MFDGALHLTEEGWRMLTWRWAFFFLFLAMLNEAVWRTQTEDDLGGLQVVRLHPADGAVRAGADAPVMRHETKEAPAEEAL